MGKKKSKKLLPESAYIKSMMQKLTMIHGTNQFTLKRGRSLKLWTVVMIFNLFLTITFIIIVKRKFDENQIVTQINANCKVNQVPFPAVSICNFNMVSLRESNKIVTILKHYEVNDKEIEAFLSSLPILKEYNHKVRNLSNFTKIMAILKSHYFTMDTIMEEVHQKCENLLLYCTFNRKQKNCDNIFSLIKTYEGYCCAFNYAALNDPSEVPLLPLDEDLEYYDDQSSDTITKAGGIIATSETGKKSGLRVIFNVEPNDYPSWSLLPYYGAKWFVTIKWQLDSDVSMCLSRSARPCFLGSCRKIMICDPNDYPETTILYRYMTLGESMDIKVDPMVFQSESDVRRVDVNKRSCVFHDEVNLAHTNRYSYETCQTECKMKTYLETCGCVPFKYPREQSVRICEFEDLLCLNNVTVHKSIEEMSCKLCFIECRDKKYSIASDLEPFLSENVPKDILLSATLPPSSIQYTIMTARSIPKKNLNVSQLASLQVYFGKSHCNCYKMSLLIDYNYFIATYGGVFSLSFGGSILTLVELLFLLLSLIIPLIMRAIVLVIYKRRY